MSKKHSAMLKDLTSLVNKVTKPLEEEIELLKKQRDQAIKRACMCYMSEEKMIWFGGPFNKNCYELDLEDMKANFPELTEHLISLDPE